MGTTKDVREVAEAEPGFAPLAGPADISVKNMGGREALSGACRG